MTGSRNPERERNCPDRVVPSAPTFRRRPSAGALVLVVDDYPDTRELFTMALRERGFRVAEATDGGAALERTWALSPDLILMDLSMPGVDGTAATVVLKTDPRSKHIPVVAVTCHDLDELLRAGHRIPFDAVIRKPCLPEDVATLVARMLDEHDGPDPESL